MVAVDVVCWISGLEKTTPLLKMPFESKEGCKRR